MKAFSFTYESMGTVWQVSIWDRVDHEFQQSLQERIISMSENFDNTYSRFTQTSFVSQLASRTGTVEVSDDFMQMLQGYQRLYLLSGKQFTPLVGMTLSDMGYDAKYTLKPKPHIKSVPEMDKVLEIIDDTHINLKQPVLFDFGAIGKGYFVEKIKAYLLDQGIKQFLVDGSGDIAYQGEGEIIQVGLEHPLDTTKVIGAIMMTDGALCGSGGNRRSWGNYHHIIRPDTLQSNHDILATWVMAESATIADGLSTALFLSEPEKFQDAYQFEYLILNKEMKVKRSKGFTAELF